jgi:hypothetical protein
MFILLQRPKFLNDSDNNIKSWNYLKYKIKYGFTNTTELICLPTIIIFISIFSFIIGANLIKTNKD